MRSIGNLCHSGLSTKEADKKARRIIQDFVMGRV